MFLVHTFMWMQIPDFVGASNPNDDWITYLYAMGQNPVSVLTAMENDKLPGWLNCYFSCTVKGALCREIIVL
jgi:hypothetical protein